MLNIIFTLDYEIHGNGEGSPQKLLIEPTNRLLNLFDTYNAKLTILADIAEILKFKEYKEKHNQDLFKFDEICTQLKQSIIRNHDVQLHIHPGYFNAEYENSIWNQDYSEYDMANLSFERLNTIIKTCKFFLESTLREVKKDYECSVFRAANWSMNPSRNIVNALIQNDIQIDTSVFKYGKYNDFVHFDYSEAYSDMVPWLVDINNICKKDDNGKLFEVPIYSEKRNILAFLSIHRFYRVLLSSIYKLGKIKNQSVQLKKKNKIMQIKNKIASLFKKHAWKMDFNQCSGKQLISGLKRAEKKYQNIGMDVPLVLIGHSKLFTKSNEKSLTPFLKYIKNNPDRFKFSLFSDINYWENYANMLQN